MVSFRTQTKLARLLEIVATGESKVELARQDLALLALFEPYTAFKRLDQAQKGYVSPRDVQDFLLDNSISSSLVDIDAVLSYYGENLPRLSYSQFSEFVLPKDDKLLRSRASLREPYPLNHKQMLPIPVEESLAELFVREIELARKKRESLDELTASHDFAPNALFRAIDTELNGSLVLSDIKSFLLRHDTFLKLKDLESLQRRLDVDRDNIINIAEFKQFLDMPVRSEDLARASIARRSVSPRRSSPSRLATDSGFYSPSKRLTTEILDRSYHRYVRGLSGSPKRQSVSKAYADYLASPERKLAQEIRLSTTTSYRTPEKRGRQLEEDYGSRSTIRKRHQSPLRTSDEELFVQALKDQIKVERDIENLKCELALRSDFNILDAFRIFDTLERGRISSSQLERGLNRFGVFPLRSQLTLLFKRMDTDSDGMISSDEFASVVLPNNPTYAASMKDHEPHFIEDPEDLPYTLSTRRIFADLMRALLDGESRTEQNRQRLSFRRDFSIYDAFKTLDRYDQGHISIEEFKKIFEDHGIFATRKDIANLVERFDHDKDGRVNFGDFYKQMSPERTKLF